MYRAIVLALLICACSAEVSSTPDRFTFLRPAPGKADGAALLSADQLHELDDQLTRAIAAADQQIASLESQIRQSEQQLTWKQNQIDSLVQQIQQRQQQVTNNYNNSFAFGLFAIFAGVPAFGAVSLAQMLNDDSQLRQLNQQLADAKTQRTQVQSEIAAYQRRRDALRGQLDTLKSAYAGLKKLLVAGGFAAGPPPDGIDGDGWGQLAEERGRVGTLSQIYDNSQQQISLLQEILKLLDAANTAVGDAVKTVQALADAADAEAKASQEGFESMLKLLLGGGDLEEWLQDELSARVREALGKLNWPAAQFADYLMGNVDDQGLYEGLIESFVRVQLSVDKPVIAANQYVNLTIHDAPGGTRDWIGVFPRGQTPTTRNPDQWAYTGAGIWSQRTPPAKAAAPDAVVPVFVRTPGQVTAWFFSNDSFSSLASVDFEVR